MSGGVRSLSVRYEVVDRMEKMKRVGESFADVMERLMDSYVETSISRYELLVELRRLRVLVEKGIV